VSVTTHWQYALLGLSLTADVFVGILLLVEVGRRIGRRRTASNPQDARAEVGVVDAAVFALLGLLIAFTFSGAASTWDTRRHLVVEEANAIGTTYLRLDVLPPWLTPDPLNAVSGSVGNRISGVQEALDGWPRVD